MRKIQHIVSVSGGKDSTATYLLALEYSQRHGFDFRAVFADTGHEHPATIEYVRNLGRITNGPEVEIVRADFSAAIARKRAFVAADERPDGWSAEDKARALEILYPTGLPFLDLCLEKGRFPSRKAQFCTEELKIAPILEGIIIPAKRAARAAGKPIEIIQWIGVRAEESAARAMYPRYERSDFTWLWRPIHRWTAAQVFDMHRRHRVEPNPLYKLGMGRVGCMPCINCSKRELAEIARRFPEQIARVAEWEQLVKKASKRAGASFFRSTNDPTTNPADGGYGYTIHDAVEWARTSRGGRQFDLLDGLPAPSCSSVYGLCDAESAPITQAAE